jgi:hypothetical protein
MDGQQIVATIGVKVVRQKLWEVGFPHPTLGLRLLLTKLLGTFAMVRKAGLLEMG